MMGSISQALGSFGHITRVACSPDFFRKVSRTILTYTEVTLALWQAFTEEDSKQLEGHTGRRHPHRAR